MPDREEMTPDDAACATLAIGGSDARGLCQTRDLRGFDRVLQWRIAGKERVLKTCVAENPGTGASVAEVQVTPAAHRANE